MRISNYSWPLSHRTTHHTKSPFTRVAKAHPKQIFVATTSRVPILAFAKTIATLPRREVAALAERLIELLDLADGDPDLEDSHDQEWIDERERQDCY